MYKLSVLNISGDVLSCLESLLNNRMQHVRIGNSVSSLRSVKSGVQQGSILGPQCFILFINDLQHYLPSHAVCKLFADDFKSYMMINKKSVNIDFNLIIASVQCWADAWQLPLSVDKCSWMMMSNKLIKAKHYFTISNTKLCESSVIKDLGVTFDSKLNFSVQMSWV